MSLLIICRACPVVLRVMDEDAKVDLLVGRASSFWPDGYVCVRCGKKAECLNEDRVDPNILRVHGVQDLTPEEAFAAMHGLGLPAEQSCSLDDVTELLKTVPIRRVRGTQVLGQARTVLESLELWDGTRVYFGAAPEGAVIYRIARPHSYATKILEELDCT
jgi:hypothetical protein